MQLQLVIQNGPEAGRTVDADPSRAVSIGRAHEADAVLSDGRVSKRHCQVAFDGSAFSITDLGSSNGTYVNGVRVTTSPLRHGDIVQIGMTELLVQDPDANAAPVDPLLGLTLGGYRILDRIAGGSRGVVYRAEHQLMRRPGAVKVLSGAFASDRKARERFLREARAGADLKHPNLVQVLEAGEEQGVLFLVMELVEGETLQTMADREGSLSLQRALHLSFQIAAALDFASGHGLVHRDLRPGNVLVASDGSAKVIDLGMALSLTGQEGNSLLTTSGLPMLEANYVAPEILFGEKDIDGRADLYSLGVTLYFLLTGRLPYAVGNPREFFDSVRAEKYLSPKAHNPSIPDEVCELIARLMASDRDERYADARAYLKEALAYYGRTYGSDTVPASVLAIPGAEGWASERSGTRYESRVARDVQAKLVPSSLPAIPGHAIAKVYRPVKIVGGDYYDVLALPGGKFALVVVDSGRRGVTGAMLMVLVRSVIHSSLDLELSPAATLLHLDQSVKRDLQGGFSLHATYATIEPQTSRVVFASAGDTPPILFRSSTGEAGPLPGAGVAIGDEGFEAPEEQTVSLDPGDRMILYSDGITTVLDTRNRAFGTEGLSKALGAVRGLPLDGALERLHHSVEAHRGPSPILDDLTILGIERVRA